MSVVVQQVVSELQFIERNDLLHPLRAFGRRVRVVMDPTRSGGVRFTGHQPRRAVEGIPIIKHNQTLTLLLLWAPCSRMTNQENTRRNRSCIEHKKYERVYMRYFSFDKCSR